MVDQDKNVEVTVTGKSFLGVEGLNQPQMEVKQNRCNPELLSTAN